ncbi:MAG: GNAT family N-acetyltransferase [Sediminibacterium sp.]|nr:GNAT family N-acetyltransferase [Sediminibacterium sp.]
MKIIKDNTKLLLFGQSTERLLFRKLEQSDFEEWLTFCEDEASLKYIWLSDTSSAHEKCKIWFDRVFNRYASHLGGMNALIGLKDDCFIGQCGLLVHTVDGIEELEIGYSLMPAYRGLGYALEAAKKCKEYAFENNLAESLISIIHVDNTASEKVAVRNGMKLEKTTLYNNSKVNIFRIHKSG